MYYKHFSQKHAKRSSDKDDLKKYNKSVIETDIKYINTHKNEY